MTTLIAIEGSDGAGKDTQSTKLAEWYVRRNEKVVKISFPRYKQTAGGWALWEALKGDNANAYNFANVDPYSASLLYAADRRESLSFLKEQIENSDVVIFDRYVESNLLHQGGKFATNEERVNFSRWLFDLEYKLLGLPKPDMVIYLKLPFEKSLERAQKRAIETGGKLDAVESNLDYVKNGHSAGIFYAERFGWEIVECVDKEVDLTPDEIHLQVVNKITRRFYLRF